MKREPIFTEVQLSDIICKNTSIPLLVIVSPNYEDRSLALVKSITKIRKNQCHRQISFMPICLKNYYFSDMLLDNYKKSNYEKLMKLLHLKSDLYPHLQYPEGNNYNLLKQLLIDKISTLCNENGVDILIDISGLPRAIIFLFCCIINNIIPKYGIRNLSIAYTKPLKYSAVNYMQDIGILYGLFSGQTLHQLNFGDIHTIIFPSRTGQEAKLLLDDISQINCEQSHVIFFPIDGKNYLSSMDLMMANQRLFDQYKHRYYCSSFDALVDLHAYLYDEQQSLLALKGTTKRKKSKRKSMYLIAPFNSKIYLPTAFFELEAMRQECADVIDIEICYTRSFQYTSQYSIGVGDTEIFNLNCDYDKN